ncbi:MAG: hypothetical protein MUO61_05975 [Dehalococcoidia bacterium]|nr:hypothetical protein [Dehalococcoidia bacterium]
MPLSLQAPERCMAISPRAYYYVAVDKWVKLSALLWPRDGHSRLVGASFSRAGGMGKEAVRQRSRVHLRVKGLIKGKNKKS